jgi:hypothetical protein
MGDYKRRADHKADPPRETFAYWRKGGARSRDVFHVTLKEGIPVETTMTLSYNDVHSAFAHGLHPITAFFGLMSFALIILLLSA